MCGCSSPGAVRQWVRRHPPGSTCIANAYTSNHDRLDSPDVGTIERFVLHGFDTVGIDHGIVLRIQALLLPVQTLVFSGGH